MTFSLETAIYTAALCRVAADGDQDGFADLFEKYTINSRSAGQMWAVTGTIANTESLSGVQAVIFRGTATLGDWLDDEESALAYFPEFDGKVHTGFYRCFDEVRDWLQSRLLKTKLVLITGHSLGGAMVTLAAQWLWSRDYMVLPTYTFGSPKVGNETFTTNYAPAQYRVVNDVDIVTYLPRISGYCHVGEEYHLPYSTVGLGRRLGLMASHLWYGPGKLFVDSVKCHPISAYMEALKREWEADHAETGTA
jgi:hypothetical protein